MKRHPAGFSCFPLILLLSDFDLQYELAPITICASVCYCRMGKTIIYLQRSGDLATALHTQKRGPMSLPLLRFFDSRRYFDKYVGKYFDSARYFDKKMS